MDFEKYLEERINFYENMKNDNPELTLWYHKAFAVLFELRQMKNFLDKKIEWNWVCEADHPQP